MNHRLTCKVNIHILLINEQTRGADICHQQKYSRIKKKKIKSANILVTHMQVDEKCCFAVSNFRGKRPLFPRHSGALKNAFAMINWFNIMKVSQHHICLWVYPIISPLFNIHLLQGDVAPCSLHWLCRSA